MKLSLNNFIAILSACAMVMLLPAQVNAVDLFAEMAMPGRPLEIAKPEWVEPVSKLKLEYSTEEYYRRWVNDRLVNDFSGHRFSAELDLQLLPGFKIGGRRKLFEPQTWENSANDKSSRFSIDSDSGAGEVFLNFSSKKNTLELGRISGKSAYSGTYDLHQDIINALGDNPPVYLDNGHSGSYARLYGQRNRLKFLLNYASTNYSHRVSANTPAMNVVLNHSRLVINRSAEISWSANHRFTPFLRLTDYRDTGDGENFKDEKFRFGQNRSQLELSSQSLGVVVPYKSSRWFAEYSMLQTDLELTTRFNLITLNPLFLFGTNEVDYRIALHPDNPWGARFGATRVYRHIEYDAQYCYVSLSGRATSVSRKAFNMFASTSSETTLYDVDLTLHRLTIGARRNDRHGCWKARLNLLVPVASSNEIKPPAPPAPPGSPAPPSAQKPEESMRGGWQLQISREFDL